VCGLEYRLSAPPLLPETATSEGIRAILVALLKVFLIMGAIIVVVVAALFAGCAFMLGGMH
jgi:hypothetical protein